MEEYSAHFGKSMIKICEETNSFYFLEKMWYNDVSHDIASSEKWCQCLDKKVQDFSVVKQN